jgi:hypothetical protein
VSGETDLGRMLGMLTVDRRPGVFVVVDAATVPEGVPVHATVVEAEGTTAVVERGDVGGGGDPGSAFAAAWLTVGVHSALEAVGLTAALSGALAAAGIPCNVLAGRHHDHLLVPVDEGDRAVAVLEGLRGSRAPVDVPAPGPGAG